MGRRGGVTEMGREAVSCRKVATAAAEQMGGIPWEQAIPAPGQTSQPRVPALGRMIPITSCCKKTNKQTKKQWGLGQQKKLPDFHHWKGQHVLRMCVNHPLQDSPPGQQLEGHQSHTGRGWSDWKQGEHWANHQKTGGSIVHFWNLLHTATKKWNRLPNLSNYLRLHLTQFIDSFST